MRCVEISASDDRMDCREMYIDPVNPLPCKCDKCGFPDLDHVPQPYFLVKSRTMTPNELALAENGNFFVRDRVRQVLELVAPGQCAFLPTCYKGSSETTPWQLAVPNHQVVTGKVDPAIPRCSVCGEPRSAHPGSQWIERSFVKPPRNMEEGEDWTGEADFEIVKSSTWGSSEAGWKKWIFRNLYLSVRLFQLFKKIKVMGFYQDPVAPTKVEAAWIKEKLALLESSGVLFHAAGTLSNGDAVWLRQFIKSHAPLSGPEWDIKAVEKRLKTKLPKSYVEFVTKVGTISFENIDDQDGFTASILPPPKLGLDECIDELADEEYKAVNPLTFAITGHGDCFCFNVQKGKKEYAVFQFKHDYKYLEPYAENFAQCIKRFASGSGS